MFKGPRRSFVVVVVDLDLDLVGVESKAKTFTVEQKMLLMEQKPFFMEPWPLYCVLWPFMAKYRFGWIIWSCFQYTTYFFNYVL